ncbi:Putative uncharacterized protein FLJ37770 [Eumeta japonica]|uniref:Mos1 transposase HTH domain-containing protein n=1 Tax=Eumeta variegata TaxID=151549 RepID=A0A4C1XTN0_EUMVA|nr:Putative uncharacterized protein FLJ37770 [Eumeta japonica]
MTDLQKSRDRKKRHVMFICLYEGRLISPQPKYFVKKGKTPKEIFEDMVSVLQESASSYTMVKKWARLFQQGRESCEDDPRPGRPVTVVTEENVRKIEKFVLADRRIKLWQTAEELQISKERVGEIIHEHMNMRKISARWYQNANAI